MVKLALLIKESYNQMARENVSPHPCEISVLISFGIKYLAK